MNETLATDRAPEGISQIFLDQGVLGAVVLVLLFVVYKLWQKNNELHEKCLTISLQVTEVANTVASSLERNTDAIERLVRAREVRP